jgi:hypothetical protein
MATTRSWKFLLFLAVLAGCSQDNRVAPLEAKVALLEKQVEQLQFQLRFQSEAKDWDQIAYLTPGSDGYAVIKMDLGHLTVNLANIASYANGSKVSLTFGNLTSATIDGLKAKVEWGSVDEKGLPKNQEAKSREIKLTESLYSGAWNKTDVVLEGVPPTALGFVRVSDVGHQGIRLRGQMK